VDKAFLNWVLDKEGADVVGRLRSVWRIFFLHDPDLSDVLTQSLLDEVRLVGTLEITDQKVCRFQHVLFIGRT
jgi:hypothetical protein